MGIFVPILRLVANKLYLGDWDFFVVKLRYMWVLSQQKYSLYLHRSDSPKTNWRYHSVYEMQKIEDDRIEPAGDSYTLVAAGNNV